MSSPFTEELALYARNNEAINEILVLTHKVNGVVEPIDLTGYTFKAQARKLKGPTSALLCDIEVTVHGDPAEGKVLLHVPETVISTLQPWKGFWDLLVRTDSGSVDNLFMAPFIIEPGVSAWPAP